MEPPTNSISRESQPPRDWRRGFWSLIVTQFQTGFNDNGLKYLVIYLIIGMDLPQARRDSLVPIVGALFAIPFILFSMTGGYFADRYSKRSVTIGTKFLEIGVMAFFIVGLALRSLPLECAGVFLISTEGALFGPSKYGLLPELLPERQLSWGNGIIEFGTFLAGIGGTIAAGELAERFLAEYASAKRSAHRQRLAIVKDVLPVIGSAKAAAVTRRDIDRIMERMIGRSVTIGASRMFEIVRKMFSWALEKGLVEHNPCLGMKKPFATRKRDRVLSPDEIRAVWAALGAAETPISRDGRDVLKLCLITGQRLGEVAGMSRDELDFAKGIWTIPSWRSKNGHAHRVPLTETALAIIKVAVASAPTEFLFPGYGKDDAVKSASVGKAVRRSRERIGIPHWTSHDLRRTAATGMADLGVAPHVIGRVLNHRAAIHSSVTDQVYNRYSYDREKRAALDLWDRELGTIIGGTAAVIPLRSA